MKTRFFFLLTSILVSYQLLAQTVFQGIIVNEQQEPLPGTVIACFRNSDNNLMRGSTTDEHGKFKIEVKESGEWIRISYLGYENIDYKDITSLPTHIMMKPANMELGEVVVQGKSIVTQKSDRLVFSIANSNITKGNNTMQLLRFTPLMRIDGNKIEMLGKTGMQLYVNGKKSNMSGDALIGYLQGLPAEKIERIELITDPGSEYRTDANEGILNLILKKDENQGWKGTLSLNDSQGYYNSYNGNLYLDYQKGKFALSSNIYGYKNREHYDKLTDYQYLSENQRNMVDQNTNLDHKMGGLNFTMDYQPSDKQTVGTTVDIFYADRLDDIYGETTFSPLSSATIDSTLFSQSPIKATQFMLTANLNYRLKTDKKGSQLSIDVDYFRTDNKNDNPFSYAHLTNGTVPSYTRFCQNTDEAYNTYSGKIEYQHVFAPKSRLKIGAESYYMDNYYNFFYGNYQNGNYIIDPQKTNQFDLDETYMAAYVTYNQVWSPKFISILGFKGEYMHRHGVQTVTSTEINRHEFSPLPSLILMFNLHKNHQLTYTMMAKTIYPHFKYLNPFRSYITPTVYQENDPNLKSRMSWINSLRYTFKQHYILSLNYMSNKAMSEFRIPVEGGFTRIMPQIYGHSHILYLIGNWNDSFFNNKLYFNASLGGIYNRSYGSLEEYKIDVSHISYMGTLDIGYLLSERHNWNIDGAFNYTGATKMADYNGSSYYCLNLSTRKSFKNGISLKVGSNFLIHKKQQRDFESETYRYKENSDYHFRKFYVELSIPFGRTKVAGAKNHSGSSSTVKNRLKTE